MKEVSARQAQHNVHRPKSQLVSARVFHSARSPRSRTSSPIQFRLLDDRVEVVDLEKVRRQQSRELQARQSTIAQLEAQLQQASAEIKALQDRLAFVSARFAEAEQKFYTRSQELAETNAQLQVHIEQCTSSLTSLRESKAREEAYLLSLVKKALSSYKFESAEVLHHIGNQTVICQKRLERAETRYLAVYKYIRSLNYHALNMQGQLDRGAHEAHKLRWQTSQIVVGAKVVDRSVYTVQECLILTNGRAEEEIISIDSNSAVKSCLPSPKELKSIFEAFSATEKIIMLKSTPLRVVQLILQSSELLRLLKCANVCAGDDLHDLLRRRWNREFEMLFKHFLKRFKAMATPPERLGTLGMRLFATDLIGEDDAEDVWMMALAFFELAGGRVYRYLKTAEYVVDGVCVMSVAAEG